MIIKIMSIDYSDMAFPKPGKKKKQKVHRKSILQQKEDKTCFLCVLLHKDFRKKYVEEHHAIFGSGRRALSEEYGLKVNL